MRPPALLMMMSAKTVLGECNVSMATVVNRGVGL